MRWSPGRRRNGSSVKYTVQNQPGFFYVEIARQLVVAIVGEDQITLADLSEVAGIDRAPCGFTNLADRGDEDGGEDADDGDDGQKLNERKTIVPSERSFEFIRNRGTVGEKGLWRICRGSWANSRKLLEPGMKHGL